MDEIDKDAQREAMVKLEKAVQPCLNAHTWKQLILIKRVVTSCYFAMEEVVQDLNTRYALDWNHFFLQNLDFVRSFQIALLEIEND